MKKPYIAGVDPGLTGAIAILDLRQNLVVSVIDMPLTKEREKRSIDCVALGIAFSAYIDDIGLAVVEDVHAMPGQGVVSMFSFGVSKGIVLGMLGLGLIPVMLTPPSVWKSCFGLSTDKNKSRAMATKLFPKSSHLWELKKHSDRAEATLLAEFGRKFFLAHDFKR